MTSGSGPPAAGPGRLRLLLVLGALTAIGPFAIDTYLPALPEIETDLGASSSTVQLTITAFLLGVAAGQLMAGPLSDRFGRRRPLIAGMLAFAVASGLCGLAPSVAALFPLRILQGLFGGAGVVIARAVVRDVYSGAAAADFYSSLMLFFGLGPILAPVIGGGLLLAGDWPIVFYFLTALGAVLAATVYFGLRETLPQDRRHAGAAGALRVTLGLFANRRLLALAVPTACCQAALLAYIAASSFVFQDHFGLSPQLFAVAFCANSAGLVLTSRVGRWSLRWYTPETLLRVGLGINLCAALFMLVAAVAGWGVWGIFLPSFALTTSIGLITPNSLAVGLRRHAAAAGGASAVFGLLQYLGSAAVAPLVGIAGSSPVPMGVVVAILATAAVAVHCADGVLRPEPAGTP